SEPGLRGLQGWVRTLQVTGRVPLPAADPRWLATHRRRDPLLMQGESVVVPSRPRTVTVIMDGGDRCTVAHESGREALAYVEACAPSRARQVDWAWLVQPDG